MYVHWYWSLTVRVLKIICLSRFFLCWPNFSGTPVTEKLGLNCLYSAPSYPPIPRERRFWKKVSTCKKLYFFLFTPKRASYGKNVYSWLQRRFERFLLGLLNTFINVFYVLISQPYYCILYNKRWKPQILQLIYLICMYYHVLHYIL